MSRRRTVAIGLLGSTLDRGGSREDRWAQWRPTVALCQHEHLLIDRFELLVQGPARNLLKTVRQDINRVSPETLVVPHELGFRDAWDLEEVYGALHDFCRAYPFDTDREDYLVHITTGTHVVQICLFLLTESRRLPGRLIQTGPPTRRSPGGPGDFRIIDLDLSRYDRIATRFEAETRDEISFLKSGIETRNAGFNELIERIERVAVRSVDPILLTGPTGAGKSRLARRIHELKRQRRRMPGEFVEVNCATLRGDGALSTLFGHRKGAFTGATHDRAGLLRAADGGMLFLDEVGELGADEQTMLLQAVEEKRFMPMGSDRPVEADFQLICGTNRDLRRDAAEGRFREDLLARINLWTFELPGLRERPEDIEPNLDYELERFGEHAGRRVTFNREARERFLRFAVSPGAAWSANFRDLGAAVTRMATLADGGRIGTDAVEAETGRLARGWEGLESGEGRTSRGDAEILRGALGEDRVGGLDLFERIQLAGVLRVCRESRSLAEAGRRLFGVSRERRRTVNDADRVRKYLAKYGLDLESAGRGPVGG